MKILNFGLAGRYLSAMFLKQKGAKIKLMLGGGLIASCLALAITGTPVHAQSGGHIYLPVIENHSGITVTVNAEFTAPYHRPAMLPIASELSLSVKWAKTEGDALKFVDNQSFVIKDKQTITGTGKVDVHFVNMDYAGLYPAAVIKAAAYAYTYHTQTKDEPQIVTRVYIRTGDGRFMTLESEAHYTSLDPALQAEDQYNDAGMLINELVELYAPPADRYFTWKVNK